MNLFQITAAPLLFLFVSILPWDADLVPRRLSLVSLFFQGVLVFFPAYVVLLILRRIVGFSYTGFALYICLLVRDHLAPLLLGASGFILIQRRLTYPATHEGIFLTAFTFLSGFYALFGIADFLALYGRSGPDAVLLMPVMRLASVLAVSLSAPTFYRWQGRGALWFLAVSGALALPLAMSSWLSGVNYGWIGALMAAGAFCAAALVFIRRFPRVLRAV
jgi:hypothetical protein